MSTNAKRIAAIAIGLVLTGIAIAVQLRILVTGSEVFAADSLYIASLYMAVSVLSIFALSFAAFYLATEFTKASSLLFKLFLCMFLITIPVRIVEAVLTSSASMEDVPVIALLVLAFGLLNVIVFAKDLGKKKSLILAYTILVLMVAISVIAFVWEHTPILPLQSHTLRNIGFALSAVVLVSTVHMKYYDKKVRHTK